MAFRFLLFLLVYTGFVEIQSGEVSMIFLFLMGFFVHFGGFLWYVTGWYGAKRGVATMWLFFWHAPEPRDGLLVMAV